MKGVVKNVTMDIVSDEFLENLEKEYDGSDWDIVSARNEDGEQIFGVGNSASHEQYDISEKEPTREQKRKFDEVVKKLNLPKPEMFSGKWHS